MTKNKYDTQHDRNLAKYFKEIEEIYASACREAAQIGMTVGQLTVDTIFAFKDFPITHDRIKTLMSKFCQQLELVIVNGVESEWTLANNKNNVLSQRVFGDNIGKLTKEQYSHYFNNHDKAREAFIQRQTAGLKLSDRVWNYTNQFQREIEMGLDVGIRSGRSADELSRDLRDYLKHPDKLFRRVRDEYGELQLSKATQAFHPGRGVYRSSYKNARRLTATETNIAYRTADYLRYQDLDFVVGIKIVLSNNHPVVDICNDLSADKGSTNKTGRGCYPKDFKFTGWHPHCRCHAETILKTEEEIMRDNERLLRGEEPLKDSVNTVTDVPQEFKDWLTDNDERMQKASSVPYFISDNTKYTGVQPHYGAVGAVTGTKLGRTATKAAFKIYENMPAPTLMAEVAANTEAIAKDFGIKTKPTPMTFLEANEGRGNVFYGKGYEFTSNCQSTVVVHEARLRGLDVTALGYNGMKGSTSYELGENFEMIWENPKTHNTPTPTRLSSDTFEGMISKIEKTTKATGRYHIGINMPNNKGHVVTAERLANGQMAYYDAQIGAFIKLEEYADRGVEYFEVLKVDKLLIRRDLFKKIARLL